MKTTLVRGLFLGSLAVSVFGLVGCSDGAVTPQDPAGITAQYVTTFDLNAPVADFNDATLEQPVQERPNPNAGGQVRNPFGPLFTRLNLTEEQRAATNDLLAKHAECVKAVLTRLRAAEREILDAARKESEDIIAKARAGEISREEARTALRELNKSTREALRNLQARAAASTSMKACDEAFVTSLAEILTEDQVYKLRVWWAVRNGQTPPPPPPPPSGDRGGSGGGTGDNGGRGKG